jgi:hypothetical protein
MESQQLVSPSRQSSTTPVGLVKDFLAKKNVQHWSNPYSPNLNPTDF